MTVFNGAVARKADDEARHARLEVVASEVIDEAILLYTAREIAAPYEEFAGSFVLADEDSRVEELSCLEFWKLCRAVGLNDCPTDSTDLHFRGFAAFVSAGQIVRFLDPHRPRQPANDNATVSI